jgi:hypothetical protein
MYTINPCVMGRYSNLRLGPHDLGAPCCPTPTHIQSL